MPRTVVKLGDDEYLEWSSIVDAPVTHIMGRAEAIREFGIERVERTDERGHSAMWCPPEPGEDFVRFNHAGPREACVTVESMRRRYRQDDPETGPLRPEEIHVGVTSWANHPDISSDRLFWTPWRPGEAPAEITDDTDLRAMVEMTPEEADWWDAQVADVGLAAALREVNPPPKASADVPVT